MDLDPHTKYCGRDAERNAANETAAQICGGFLMDLGDVPWDAERLLELLENGGFEIRLKPQR